MEYGWECMEDGMNTRWIPTGLYGVVFQGDANCRLGRVGGVSGDGSSRIEVEKLLRA